MKIRKKRGKIRSALPRKQGEQNWGPGSQIEGTAGSQVSTQEGLGRGGGWWERREKRSKGYV